MAIYNTQRISGMISGMDTDELVRNMVKNKQSRVDRQYQAITKKTWQREAYQDIRDKLAEFESKYLSVTGSNTMMNSSTYVNNKVDASDLRGYATITANSEAKSGTYRMSVNQLAAGAHMESTKVSYQYMGEGTLGKASSKLKDLNWAKSLQTDEDGNFSFKINDVEFKFNKEDTLQHVINTIDTSRAGVTLTYSEATDGFRLESKAMGEESKIVVENLTGNFFGENSATGLYAGQLMNGQNSVVTVNGIRHEGKSNKVNIDGIAYNLLSAMGQDTVIQYASGAKAQSSRPVSVGGLGLGDPSTALRSLNWGSYTQEQMRNMAGNQSFEVRSGTKSLVINLNLDAMSLEQAVDHVNKQLEDAGMDVTMTYSHSSDNFTFTEGGTGAGSNIELRNVNGGSLMTEYAADGSVAKQGLFGIDNRREFAGKNAVAIVGGERYESSTNEITTATNGKVNINDIKMEEEVFTVERDVDASMEKIKEFVKDYNALFKGFYDLTKEKQYRKYPPLTEEEREALEAEEIEKWDEKSKSGILRSDAQLTRLLDDMRALFSTKVGGTGQVFASIGITTGEYRLGEAAQIEIDEDKLRNALQENGNAVMSMFMSAGTTDKDDKVVEGTKGLVTLMRETAKAYDTTMKFDVLQDMDTELLDMDDRLTDLKTAMEEEAERWYMRFAQMEQALAGMQGQQQWIGNQMGMGGK